MVQEFEPIRLRVQCTGIHGAFEFSGGLLSGDRRQFRSLEPTVFLDLMVRNAARGLLGTHDDDRLELAIYFPVFTPDKKLADIKFSQLLPSHG